MTNLTELHRMRIDQGGTTASFAVRQALSMQMDDIVQLKHTSGVMFIELYAEGNQYDIDVLEHSRKFWSWWCKLWAITDFKLIQEPVTPQIYVNAHTRISDIRVIESFKQQYDLFLKSGIDTIEKGGIQ